MCHALFWVMPIVRATSWEETPLRQLASIHIATNERFDLLTAGEGEIAHPVFPAHVTEGQAPDQAFAPKARADAS
jgi:hypothetical protein